MADRPAPRPGRRISLGARDIVAIVAAIVMLVLVFQNTNEVRVRLFFWTLHWPLWLALLVTLVLGLLIGWAVGRRRGRNRRD